ncbi:MAG: hypothetical protein FWE44_00350 [Defluviitaleaceae bacterium]|nr:hypothetical protein [Defluviitaleaceae bacterium]
MIEITVSGQRLPAPDAYSIGYEDIGEFARNANGNMVADIVATKALVNCGWKLMTTIDHRRLVQGADDTFVRVRYFCTKEGGHVEKIMHPHVKGGRVVAVNNEMRWKDVSCDFIER